MPEMVRKFLADQRLDAWERLIDPLSKALLEDLKSRGLLDSTLVVWGGEFGRTPLAQGQNGRDHHPYGFSIWMAGAGIHGGRALGATDDFGVRASEMRVDSHGINATILRCWGSITCG